MRTVTKTCVILACHVWFSGAAQGQTANPDCQQLGISSSVLAERYCAALQEIAEGDEITRGMGGGVIEDLPAGLADNVLVQDAYRADPRKTLDLIKRIKEAGGLTD